MYVRLTSMHEQCDGSKQDIPELHLKIYLEIDEAESQKRRGIPRPVHHTSR